MPVSMMAPLKVSLSTIAAQRRGSVKVFVQPEKGLIGGEHKPGERDQLSAGRITEYVDRPLAMAQPDDA